MEVLYWKFEGHPGVWTVKAGRSDMLETSVLGTPTCIYVIWKTTEEGTFPVWFDEGKTVTGTRYVIGTPPPPCPTIKPTNPKDAVGVNKVCFSVVPANVLGEVAAALTEGALKYGRHNYRGVGVRHSVYYDGALRHLTAWWEGEDIDPESQLSHVTKAITGLMVLRDCMLRGNDTDDRPPKSPKDWMAPLNERTKALRLQYQDKSPQHYFEKETQCNWTSNE